MKKTITLEGENPVGIYGASNKILEEFCTYFPGLKVVARGSELILDGKESQIQEFTQKFAELVESSHRKMNLTRYDVEDLFNARNTPDQFRLNGEEIIVYSTDGKPIRARNLRQQEMVKAYFDNDLVFAVGPAGTGKTYIAIALAVRALKNREIKRIILTRPAVEAGERLGFLPGDLKDKLDPYLQPLYDALGDMIPGKKLQEFLAEGTIQIAPLAYMRGRTLDRACVILDEAQNTNIGQLKMFLTRMGMSAKFIVTGDATQVDLPRKEDSGLLAGIRMLEKIKGIATIRFSSEDIVRHPLVGKIVKAFDRMLAILVLIASLSCVSAFAGTCPKCKGRGVVQCSNPPVSHFGINKKIGDCEICGQPIFKGETHRHTVCPSCNGTGSSGKGSSSNGYSDNESSAEDYDGVLSPEEYFRVEALARTLFQGMTETRQCSTCNGTGRCPGPGLHHYGNVSDMLDLNSPTPNYCPLCGGWGTCPNRNCVNGIESYIRPCTEGETEEINREIKSIYANAYQREYGEQMVFSDDGTDEDGGWEGEGDFTWETILGFIIIIGAVILLFKKSSK